MSESGSESSSSESNHNDGSGIASPEGSSSAGEKSPESNASYKSRSSGSAPASPDSQNSEHSPVAPRRNSPPSSPNIATEKINKESTSPPASPISARSLTPISDRSSNHGGPASPGSDASSSASPEASNEQTREKTPYDSGPRSSDSDNNDETKSESKVDFRHSPKGSPASRDSNSRPSSSKSPPIRTSKKGKSILSPILRRRKDSSKYDDEDGLDDSDNEEVLSPSKNAGISHDDDLSDVSDLDNMGDESQEATDLRENSTSLQDDAKKSEEKLTSLEVEHEHLDFEADGQWKDEKEEVENELSKETKDENDRDHQKHDVDKDREDEKSDDKDEDQGSIKINGTEEDGETDEKDAKDSEDKNKKVAKGSDLEEGELSDGEEARPEETEPRPVCRFFSRGQCTWGVSCRFLHPGVTDKGNYTMFDVVRPVNYPGHIPVPNPHEFRPHIERPPLMRGPPPFLSGPPKIEDPSESAWERGLRHAKEMMRKANKRKELDMNFEEKKMNLSLGQDDIDREAEYYVRPGTPEPPIERWPPVDAPIRRRLRVTPDYLEEPDAFYQPDYYRKLPYKDGRAIPDYRDRPDYHMLPRGASHHSIGSPPMTDRDYYDRAKYERKHKRPSREVIIERIPSSKYRDEDGSFARGRGDEWTDSWMKRKSPVGRHTSRRLRKQSYSSGSSYSSSSSSRSSSRSSYSSYDSASKSRSFSPSPRSRNSKKIPATPPPSSSTAQRGIGMNPPAPSPRAMKKSMSPQSSLKSRLNPALSPLSSQKQRDKQARDKAASAAAAAVAKVIKSQSRSRSSGSSSGSESSGSSSDSSESSYSSSSSGGKKQKGTTPPLPRKDLVKAIESVKPQNMRQPIKLTLKSTQPVLPAVKKVDRSTTIAGKKRPAESLAEAKLSAAAALKAAKKSNSRRDELLKQLKAVEDAIARKRSKI